MGLLQSPWRIALAGSVALAFSMGVGRFAFTPLLPLMEAEGRLSVAGGGGLASIHFLGYAIGAFAATRLPQAPAAVLGGSLAAIGIATLAMGLTNDYAAWLVARGLAGIFSAFALVVVSTHLVSRLREAGRPDLQGWVFAGVGVGTALVGLATLGFVATGAGSDFGWIAFGLATAASTGFALALRGGKRRAEHVAVPRPRQGIAGAWRLALPYGAMGAGYVIPATYLPIMGREIVAAPLVFGWSWPAFGLAAAVSTLAAVRLQGRLSNRSVWLGCQIVMAAGLLLPAVWASINAVAAGGVCVGGTFVVITMLAMMEAHRVAGPTRAHGLIPLMTAAFAVGQIVGPVAAGWLYAETGGFTAPLLLASGLLLASLTTLVRPLPDAA